MTPPSPDIFVLDNYDSFTYNLVQYLGKREGRTRIERNDKVTVSDVLSWGPDGIIISPGPGRPEQAGISEELVREAFDRHLPLLGVCLGHQAIGTAFGGHLKQADRLMHGKTSEVYHGQQGLFRDMENPVTSARYHSLLLDRERLPEELTVTAWTEQREVMGIQHTDRPIEGVQFHPESILTERGRAMLNQFVASIPLHGKEPDPA